MSKLDEQLRQAAREAADKVDTRGVHEAVLRRTRRAGTRRRRTLALALIVALLVTAAVVSLGVLPARHHNATRPAGPPTSLTTAPAPLAGRLALVAMTPGGTDEHGAYVGQTVYVLALGTTSPRRVGPPDSGAVAWSPSGARLAFTRGTGEGSSELVVVNADGSGATTVLKAADPGNPQQVSWSPVGDEIAFTTGHGTLEVVRSDGTGRRVVDAPARGCSDGQVAWAPDGTRLAVARDCPGDGAARGAGLWLLDRNGRAARRVVAADASLQGVSWSPDGRQLAFGWPAAPSREPSSARPAQPPAGIYLVRPDGTGLRRLTDQQDQSPAWSPDGLAVAFVRDAQAWVVPAAGGAPTQLTHLPRLKVMRLAWAAVP